MKLRVRTVTLDHRSPLLDLSPVHDAVAWVRDGEGLVGWGTAARIEPGRGADRFVSADAALRDLASDAEVEDHVGLPGTGLVGFGSFTFDEAAAGSVLLVPRVVVGRRHGTTWLTAIDPVGADPAPDPAPQRLPSPPRDRPRYAGSSKPDVHWLEAVATALDRIRTGDVGKVVLARDHAVWSREPFDPLDLARRLTGRFPSCHTFLVAGLVGATPELLLARSGDLVRSRALAGTAARGKDEARDASLGSALLASDKDRREHAYAADSVREVLGGFCSDLTHDPRPTLVRLDNVQHLGTAFTGTLAAPHTSLEIVAALHPTAAVGGSPRDTALALIRELEGLDRGRYAGPVGWTDPAGDGEWGIALRCAELAGARARLFAGGGIVAASLPEAELEETRLKLLAMQAALGATDDAS